MTPERYRKILAVLARRQPDLTVITDDVHKKHNIAAVRRTCDALGVGEIHSVIPPGEKSFRCSNISAGTYKWVKRWRHDNIEQAVEAVRAKQMKIVAADFVPGAIEIDQYDFTQPTAILLGSERRGIESTSRQYADEIIKIPMIGMVDSYNVSVAFSLILMEAYRQRQKAGLYNRQRLPDAEVERLAFEWGYPKLKNMYQARGIPYPQLDEDGYILDP